MQVGVVLVISGVFALVAVAGQVVKIVHAVTKNEHEIISWIAEIIMIVANALLGLLVIWIISSLSSITWSQNCNILNSESVTWYYQKMNTYFLSWIFIAEFGLAFYVAGIVVSLVVGDGAAYLKEKIKGLFR
jgi:type III secretory pathway component EscS